VNNVNLHFAIHASEMDLLSGFDTVRLRYGACRPLICDINPLNVWSGFTREAGRASPRRARCRIDRHPAHAQGGRPAAASATTGGDPFDSLGGGKPALHVGGGGGKAAGPGGGGGGDFDAWWEAMGGSPKPSAAAPKTLATVKSSARIPVSTGGGVGSAPGGKVGGDAFAVSGTSADPFGFAPAPAAPAAAPTPSPAPAPAVARVSAMPGARRGSTGVTEWHAHGEEGEEEEDEDVDELPGGEFDFAAPGGGATGARAKRRASSSGGGSVEGGVIGGGGVRLRTGSTSAGASAVAGSVGTPPLAPGRKHSADFSAMGPGTAPGSASGSGRRPSADAGAASGGAGGPVASSFHAAAGLDAPVTDTMEGPLYLRGKGGRGEGKGRSDAWHHNAVLERFRVRVCVAGCVLMC